MEEIIFIVEESMDGGFTAKSLQYPIFTEGDTFDEVKANVKEAILCHFEYHKTKRMVRLHLVKDEVFAV